MRISIFLLLALILLCCLPTAAFASDAEGGGWGWVETVGRWLNLAVLFGAIYYFTREPIKKFFVERREGIQDDLARAERAKAEAERQLQEMQAKMSQLDEELAALRTQAEAEAEAERVRIVDQAEVEAQKIVETAEREISGLTRAARQDLQAYAAKLSVELAREDIQKRLTPEAEAQLVDRFIVKLKAEHGEKG